MNSLTLSAAVLVVVGGTMSGITSDVAVAQSKTPQHALDANGDYVDSNGIWRWVFRSNVPMNLSYDEMTPAQRALVRAQYRGMPDNDEPPFPKDGMEILDRVVVKLEHAALAKGSVRLMADIGADGFAVSVRIIQTPNQDVARIAAEAILLTPFKPGKCSGRPCRMPFPFGFDLKLNLHE